MEQRWSEDGTRTEMSDATERTLTQDDEEATQANLMMEREFYNRDGSDSSAEAVDVPQMFRNES